MPAGYCIASHRPLVAPPSRRLVAPAGGCCIASRRPLIAPPSRQLVVHQLIVASSLLVLLFKIPHKPPAGSLKVSHAPARWGGIRRAPQTKIYNLETGTREFVSNPPFSKTNLAEVIKWLSFRRERSLSFGGNDGLKKNRKPGIFKIVLNSGTPTRKLFQII